MRTTLEIDDSVIAAARAIARDSGVSLGSAISDLARAGLRGSRATSNSSGGFPVFEPSAAAEPITVDLVNAHRDD